MIALAIDAGEDLRQLKKAIQRDHPTDRAIENLEYSLCELQKFATAWRSEVLDLRKKVHDLEVAVDYAESEAYDHDRQARKYRDRCEELEDELAKLKEQKKP